MAALKGRYKKFLLANTLTYIHINSIYFHILYLHHRLCTFYVFLALLISAVLICFGMTFIILACAIPQPKLFYPFFVFIFYILSIIPVIIARRMAPNNETNPRSEFALFLAAGFVLSAFALPIILARCAVITWLACWLTVGGNIINYLTMLGYAMKDAEFDAAYGGMF